MPGIPAESSVLVAPALRLIAFRYGVKIPKDLQALAAENPGAIAKFLELECSSCLASRRERMALRAAAE